jgi:hypothetical protein
LNLDISNKFSDLANLDAVMDRLDVRLNNKLSGNSDHPSLFRAVVPVRVLRDTELRSPAMPAFPMGVAIDPRADGHILKLGGL